MVTGKQITINYVKSQMSSRVRIIFATEISLIWLIEKGLLKSMKYAITLHWKIDWVYDQAIEKDKIQKDNKHTERYSTS